MRRLLRTLVYALVLAGLAALAWGWTGFRAARTDAPVLAARADAMISAGRGGVDLGAGRQAILLAVEDPAFVSHYGIDFTTPGAGSETISESLAPEGGLADRVEVLRRIRQAGYALGLESRLTKAQILALYLDAAVVEARPDGSSLRGLFAASQAQFGKSPSALEDAQFLALVAVLADPATFRLSQADAPPLSDRIARIASLLAGLCAPRSHDDVALDGCSG